MVRTLNTNSVYVNYIADNIRSFAATTKGLVNNLIKNSSNTIYRAYRVIFLRHPYLTALGIVLTGGVLIWRGFKGQELREEMKKPVKPKQKLKSDIYAKEHPIELTFQGIVNIARRAIKKLYYMVTSRKEFDVTVYDTAVAIKNSPYESKEMIKRRIEDLKTTLSWNYEQEATNQLVRIAKGVKVFHGEKQLLELIKKTRLFKIDADGRLQRKGAKNKSHFVVRDDAKERYASLTLEGKAVCEAVAEVTTKAEIERGKCKKSKPFREAFQNIIRQQSPKQQR
ncbi:hypothetical protein [Rickettsiales endosymbiont of Stachyamoeba lipophora]|uniref:hypothetical protein n=1 Tax=Rickettsiales endosymbiont of Stachyamoeba lipophora TaxID=2486578 RepID=UPI000F64A404|nr:hypothetical protein [Rickettsiales endosymbiont of Stachyamoeba lipophora]AZL16174.1 hypothetical protein EF513_06490 [Rickettsiales endosymbiont of Stachyamoeba lipophora]